MSLPGPPTTIRVPALLTHDRVVTGAAVEPVIPGPAEQEVGGIALPQELVRDVPGNVEERAAAKNVVVPRAAKHRVGPESGFDAVIALLAEDDVAGVGGALTRPRGRAANEIIVAATPEDRIDLVQPFHRIGTREAKDEIGVRRAKQCIGTAGAADQGHGGPHL
jgi:hypothetical protein